MPTDNFQGNVFIAGTLQCNSFVCPANSITDPGISAPSAGASGVQTSKLNHRQHVPYNQPEGTAVVSESRIVWGTNGTAGITNSFKAALKVACVGAATVTVDLRKNGTTVLTSVITFNSSTAIMTLQSATIATSGLVAGDILEVVVTATAGGGTIGQGLYAEAIVDEYPS